MAIRNADSWANIRINFPITFSVVGILTLLLITAWFAEDTKSVKDTLIFFLAGAAAVGQVTASIYTARTLAATLSIRDEDLKLKARQYAMDFGVRFNDPAMYAVRDACRELLDHTGSHDEMVDLCNARRTNIIHLFNFLEEICTAVHEEMVDPALIRRQFSGVVTSGWSKAWPWIQSHRKLRGQPDIWEDLERVYDQWKKKP